MKSVQMNEIEEGKQGKGEEEEEIETGGGHLLTNNISFE